MLTLHWTAITNVYSGSYIIATDGNGLEVKNFSPQDANHVTFNQFAQSLYDATVNDAPQGLHRPTAAHALWRNCHPRGPSVTPSR